MENSKIKFKGNGFYSILGSTNKFHISRKYNKIIKQTFVMNFDRKNNIQATVKYPLKLNKNKNKRSKL